MDNQYDASELKNNFSRKREIVMQPHTSYLVCGTPRSGSSLLCEALIRTEISGLPEEYFLPRNQTIWQKQWQTSGYTEYLASVFSQGTTPNGVFGSKMMWGYFGNFLRSVRRIPAYSEPSLSAHNLMQAVFPNLHYIWIKRLDKVRQAVSHAKARQTNEWKVTDNALVSQHLARKPIFSYQQIDYMIQELEMQDNAWQRYFTENHIQPFIVVYEDFVRQYEETTIQILDYLNIPEIEEVTFAPRRMKKQADGESDQWVQFYYQLKTESKRHRLLSCANRLLLLSSQPARLEGLITKMSLKSTMKLRE